MNTIVGYKVGNTLGTFEDLWWYCECEKHNKYYKKMILDNQSEYKLSGIKNGITGDSSS